MHAQARFRTYNVLLIRFIHVDGSRDFCLLTDAIILTIVVRTVYSDSRASLYFYFLEHSLNVHTRSQLRQCTRVPTVTSFFFLK
jgi:hypothetical protein